MKRHIIMFAIVAVMLFAMPLGILAADDQEAAVEPAISYDDVEKDYWGYDVINTVTENGYMNGYEENNIYTFKYDRNMSRAEFVTILGRFEGINSDAAADYKFTDIKEVTASWAGAHIAWANQNGIVVGRSETEFDPDASITREEMAAIIGRYLKYKEYSAEGDFEKVTFSDKDNIAKWAQQDVANCVAAGVINGMDNGTFAPANNMTRIQAAVVLCKILGIAETKEPVISNVSITSNSAKGADKAANGDIITLTFTANTPVEKLSNFKINSSNPDTFTKKGNVYTATHVVDEGDKITGEPATFQINVKNANGIYSKTIEVTNDNSSVTIVDEKPVISDVKIFSDNEDTTKATIGDIITLTFVTDEPVEKLSNFKINGSNPDEFTCVANDDNTYTCTATHTVDEGDAITGEPATFQINVKNSKGIFSLTIEETNNESAVTIIK